MIRQLDPENSLADSATFYKQVDANVVHQFLVNSFTATGYSNVLQGHEDEIRALRALSQAPSLLMARASFIWFDRR